METVSIRLFGLLSTYGGPSQFTVKAQTVREALRQVSETGVDKELLSGALVFINGKPLTGARRLGKRLQAGDEVALLSPAGGG